MIRRSLNGALLIVGIIGAVMAIALWRDTAEALRDHQILTSSLMRAAVIAREIGSAQQAYVAPGQPDQPWFDRTRDLVAELSASLDTTESLVRSAESPALVGEARRAVAQLVDADARVQSAVENGLHLSAADLIFTDARDAESSIVSAVTAVDRAERDYLDARRAQNAALHWSLLAGATIAWVAAALLWRTRRTAPTVETTAAITPAPTEIEATPATSAIVEAPASVDLGEAAAVCVQLSRIASVDALPGLLGRAARVLDASGVILWMGAGEELFPVTGYGYDTRTLARLGPIRRHARNATAATWRTGEARTVAGVAEESGALAVPMLGVDGCFGVFTAEFRNGREGNPAIAAVTSMFAAQLSTIVPAWPAPSDAHASSDRPPMAASL